MKLWVFGGCYESKCIKILMRSSTNREPRWYSGNIDITDWMLRLKFDPTQCQNCTNVVWSFLLTVWMTVRLCAELITLHTKSQTHRGSSSRRSYPHEGFLVSLHFLSTNDVTFLTFKGGGHYIYFCVILRMSRWMMLKKPYKCLVQCSILSQISDPLPLQSVT
jgi:hypothetical protein